ncbi:MAG: FecR domain-containing protein [Armatimonadota bacterium]
MDRPSLARTSLLGLLLHAAILTPAFSQQARITALVGVVSKQVAGSNTWQPCRLNTPLASGDRVRTAARSRCQITFADGSVVRVGQRSDLTVRGPRSVSLSRGRMYGNFAKGAKATVGGRSAVAAVKGTRLEFIMTAEDGDEVVRCHAGQVYVAQAGVMVKTGTADSGTTTTLTDDALTEPDGYWNGAICRILAGTNEGEERNVIAFDAATRTITVDVAFPQAIDNTSEYELVLPQAEQVVTLGPGQQSTVKPGQPPSQPTPTPPEEFAGGDELPEFQQLTPGVSTPTFVGSSDQSEFRDDNITADDAIEQAIGAPTPTTLEVIVRSTGSSRHAPDAAGPLARVTAAPEPFPTPSFVSPVATWAAAAPSPFAAVPAAPEDLTEPPVGRGAGGLLGDRVGVELFAFGSNRNAIGAVRLRPSGVLSRVYFELGGATRQLFDGQDITDFTAAYVTARGEGLGDLRIGRQRFLIGPVNNSNLGTLINFDLADAISWSPDTDGRVKLDFAYLWDLDPLAEDFAGSGWFGRASLTANCGIFSVNTLFSDSDRPGPGETTLDGDFGFSFDLAVPLDRHKLELYGEVGEDPWDRTIYTAGLYFPCLYYSADTDVFVEFASREHEPNVWSVRAYKTVGDNWQAVLAAQLPEGDNLDYGLGFGYKFDIR